MKIKLLKKLNKFYTELVAFFKVEKKEDSGLRGTFEGRLYVDKKVFYNRPKVKEIIKKLSKKNLDELSKNCH